MTTSELTLGRTGPTAGFALRRANFADTIEFYAPGLKRWETPEWKPTNPKRFLPISVTGSACALSCDHCQSKVLEGMISVKAGEDLFDLAAQLKSQGSEGLLVSGGSTKAGGVPMLGHLKHVPRIRDELGMKVIAHSGVVSPALAEGLADAGVDGVMLDIIGADETIHDVYHLDLTTADFERSLALLADRGLRIIPHIVCGLHYGTFLGEHRALEMISRYPVSTLIIVVLVPLVGTPMGHLPPPPVDDVVDFFAEARAAMPTTKVNLGCARPLGTMKSELDQAAIDHGLNGIAYPADGAIAYARSRGLEPKLYEYCCSLTWTGDEGEAWSEVKLSCLMDTWRLLTHVGVGAAAGLALDEAMLAGYARPGVRGVPGEAVDPATEPTLRLYTYRSHCALVGRYQHLEAEVDLDACRRTGTGWSRRPTGGGAIVMGAGQLGVAVATRAPADQNPRALLARYAEGIVAGLAELGIEATFAGKNDLSVAGRKIAGLGLYLEPGGGLLFHSSILADLDIPFMLEVLNIPAAKLGDKAVAAVAERITTVSRETGRMVDGADIREVIATGFAKALGVDLRAGTTTPAEEARAAVLEAERYGSEEWCFEHSPQPDATATSVFKTPEGLVRCYLALHGPTIKSALFTGDFNAVPEPLARFEASLRWARLEEATLEKLAAASCPDGTGLGVPPSELVKAVLTAGERAVAPAAAPVRPSGSCYFPEDRS